MQPENVHFNEIQGYNGKKEAHNQKEPRKAYDRFQEEILGRNGIWKSRGR